MFFIKNRIKEVSFSKKMFLTLFFSSGVSAFSELLVELLDGMIAGMMIGGSALTAIAVIAPTYMIVNFISALIVKGSSYAYSRELGKLNKQRASEIFGQGVIICVMLGVVYFVSGIALKNVFFDFMKLSDGVRSAADAYFKYYKYIYFLSPIEYILEIMVYTDGDDQLVSIASFISIGFHIALPVLLINKLGIQGVAIGSVVSMLAMICLISVHFFKKSNDLHFTWHFSFKDIKEIVPLSLADSIYLLCSGLITIVLNKFVIHEFSEEYIPILTATLSVYQMTLFFEGTNKALKPIAEIYMGENNIKAEKDLYYFAVNVSLIESITISLLVVIAAPLFLMVYGIKDPNYVDIGIASVRIMACSLPFMSVSFIISSQNLIFRKIGSAMLIMSAGLLIVPLVDAVVCGFCFFYNSMFIGFAFGAFIVALVSFLIQMRGKRNSTKQIKENNLQIVNKSFRIAKDNVVNIRNSIEDALLSVGYPESKIYKMMLLTEEYLLNVIQQNKKNKLTGEFSVVMHPDALYVYLRDNGKLIDWSNVDNPITDMASYVLYNLIDTFKDKRYLSALNYNRIVFRDVLDAE